MSELSELLVPLSVTSSRKWNQQQSGTNFIKFIFCSEKSLKLNLSEFYGFAELLHTILLISLEFRTMLMTTFWSFFFGVSDKNLNAFFHFSATSLFFGTKKFHNAQLKSVQGKF